jgi:hypothetical protein
MASHVQDVEGIRGTWWRCRDAHARAIEMLELVRSEIASSTHRRDWMERNAEVFLGAVEACLELDDVEAALEVAERGRGRTLIDLLNLRTRQPRGIDDETWSAYRVIVQHLESSERRGESNDLSSAFGERASGSLSSSPEVAMEKGERLRLLTDLEGYETRFREADPDYFPTARPLATAGIRDVARLVSTAS